MMAAMKAGGKPNCRTPQTSEAIASEFVRPVRDAGLLPLMTSLSFVVTGTVAFVLLTTRRACLAHCCGWRTAGARPAYTRTLVGPWLPRWWRALWPRPDSEETQSRPRDGAGWGRPGCGHDVSCGASHRRR